MPRKSLGQNLIVATWNLRDFGRKKGSGFNPQNRLGESFYYIAEIMNRFDIIAVQEVNENLYDLERLMDVLGKQYRYLATDICEGAAGNDERVVFIYDTRKVSFRNIAGEIVLPNSGKYAGIQFARTPYIVSFQCGWFKFDLCSTHLYYGQASGEKYERRVREIQLFSQFMTERAVRTGANTFILGDFNVVGPNDPTWDALYAGKFTVPESIKGIATNVDESKHYDQIAFHSVRNEVSIATNDNGRESAGTFRIFDHVFDQEGDYTDLAKNVNGDFRKWSTWQMSDHMPLWIELKTDFADAYLGGLKNGVATFPQSEA
ncbi:MAG: endonuclease/exonuclease/phosphatase family protein [Fibrella sp.]|nr:endonuclease/exonuclease/phosphatase family protein [Armatimonadota bacterium]